MPILQSESAVIALQKQQNYSVKVALLLTNLGTFAKPSRF